MCGWMVLRFGVIGVVRVSGGWTDRGYGMLHALQRMNYLLTFLFTQRLSFTRFEVVVVGQSVEEGSHR